MDTIDTTITPLTRLIHLWHDWFIWDMTHSYMTRPVYMWHGPFQRDWTHSYVFNDHLVHGNPFICHMAQWLIQMRHDSFFVNVSTGSMRVRIHTHPSCVCTYIHSCGMTRSFVPWRIPSVCNYSTHPSCVCTYIRWCDATHFHVIWLTHVCHDHVSCVCKFVHLLSVCARTYIDVTRFVSVLHYSLMSCMPHFFV